MSQKRSDWIPPPTYVKGFHNEESIRRTTYRQLGETDIVVSKLSLGGGPFGGLYGNTESAEKIIGEALKHGVNYIDTAFWYGQGRSEEVIGKALKKIPRRAYYIATKVGRYELDYARMFDFRAEKVLQTVDDALFRLGLCCLDVIQVQIHDLEFAPNEKMILYETLPALDLARRSGKCRYIGITGYPVSKIARIVEQSTVKIDVVLTYCRGTMHDGSLGEYMSYFQKHGIGVINAAPVSMGLLTPQGPPAWHPASTQIKEACAKAVKEAEEAGASVTRLATHYSMNFAGVHTCLAGAHSLEVLRENLYTSWSDLSEKERNIRKKIMETYLDPLCNANWEGIEVQNYLREAKKAGISLPITSDLNQYDKYDTGAAMPTKYKY